MASFWRQFALLGQRALVNSWRNPLVAKGKLGQTVFMGLIVALIYLKTGNDLKSVQDRQGSLFFIIINGGPGPRPAAAGGTSSGGGGSSSQAPCGPLAAQPQSQRH
jgi:hypothetical protein